VRHAAREADESAADFLQGLGLEVPDRLVAGGARARRGDVLRVQQFQGLGIRSRFRGGEGAEAKADAGMWSEDVAASLKKAAAEKKDVLMDFTGSDWCGWCIKLKTEVFDQAEFQKDALAKFVFVNEYN
jgi:thiol:disulfide interchange protein